MKILAIDARMIGSVGHGIGKYVEGIALNLSEGDALTMSLLRLLGVSKVKEVEIIFFISPNCPKDSPVRSFRNVTLDTSVFNPVSWFRIPFLLSKFKVDLFFNPSFASFPILPCEYVQTVHDLNHLHFGNIAHWIYYNLLLKRSIRLSAKVFTVSLSVKDELVKWSGVDPPKIEVYYNNFESFKNYTGSCVSAVLSKYKLRHQGYFFCVANGKRHKNVQFLINAFRHYRLRNDKVDADEAILDWSLAFKNNEISVKSSKPLALVLTAAMGDLECYGDENIIFAGDIDWKTMAILYQECAGFYFPSLYEGFGRPPVEAALAGVHWIVVSDIPAHHEAEKVAGKKFKFLRV